jgi:hypothetical protein
MLNALGFSPEVVNTRSSKARLVPPEADRIAPPVAEELLQPLPGPLGGFEQGQTITPAVPGSHSDWKLVPISRSRRKMSAAPFVSPKTRLDASLANAT